MSTMVKLCKTHLAIMLCGGFLKCGYPQIIHFTRIFHLQTIHLEYPHFLEPPISWRQSLPFLNLGSPSIPLSSMTPQLNRCRTPSTWQSCEDPRQPVDGWMVFRDGLWTILSFMKGFSYSNSLLWQITTGIWACFSEHCLKPCSLLIGSYWFPGWRSP